MSKVFDALVDGDDDGLVRALREGADPEAREHGETPLYRAAVANRPVAVRVLLAAGADPGRASGEDDGDLPLCGAACGGHAEVVRALLAAGAEPDQEEAYGFTALAWAVRLGHTEVVRALLEAGADPDRPGPDGLAPLTAAARRGSASAVRALLDHGAGRDRAVLQEALAEARRWIGADMAAVLRRGLVESGGAGDTYEAVVRRVPEDGGVTVVVELLREDGAPSRGDERQTSHAAIATLLEAALGIRVPPEELADRALRCGASDRDDWLTAVTALADRADETALTTATAWCASPDPLRRALGTRVLAALPPTLRPSAVPVLRRLAREVSETVAVPPGDDLRPEVSAGGHAAGGPGLGAASAAADGHTANDPRPEGGAGGHAADGPGLGAASGGPAGGGPRAGTAEGEPASSSPRPHEAPGRPAADGPRPGGGLPSANPPGHGTPSPVTDEPASHGHRTEEPMGGPFPAGGPRRQGAAPPGGPGVPPRPATPGAERELVLAVVFALGECGDPRVVPELLRFAGHPEAEVRRQVAASLTGLVPPGDGEAVAVLVGLSRDHDPRVRDWATLALAELPVDTPVVREALAARLGDPDPDAAAEAARGLAIRQDPRAVEALARILADGDPEGAPRETALAALEHVRDPRIRTRLEWTTPRCR
ncbi:ankyrin repeat domain-containing protein [Streptomyces sp. NPDC126499]|uniref:ankyrin repeat domain-containing protein n=1 Tax=Streptomyces sp. NPDC126499 TaxID=3155314 RepID=UPI0033261843